MTQEEIMMNCGIAAARTVPFSSCRVINPRKASSLGFNPLSVCVGIIPYYSHACDAVSSVSKYAIPRDYHIFAAAAADRITEEFGKQYPGSRVRVFCDNSPIDEKGAASAAGLGVIGRNGLLITEMYSSFVFIIEAISDIPTGNKAFAPLSCENCGRCAKACPTGMKSADTCLSFVSQKKGTLSAEEERLLISSGCVWGCDICQDVCPYTIRAKKAGTIYTNLPWFEEKTINNPSEEHIYSEETFRERAYSWRGKGPVLRNIALMKKEK